MPTDDPNQPQNRRAIFRLGLQNVMRPLAGYIESRFDLNLPADRPALRPPGALDEDEFLQTCYRCGHCVEVCPAKAIRPLGPEKGQAQGTPYIDPDLAACVVCESLACMNQCPSTALKPVGNIRQINMGLAHFHPTRCLRTQGQDCTLCVDKCPIGPVAIHLDRRGRVEVQPDGCVGCGCCQFFCPTNPKAIVVDF